MYTLITDEHARKMLQRELLPAAVSLTIAEVAFKFHSFVLECTTFLVTWYACSYVVSRCLKFLAGQKKNV